MQRKGDSIKPYIKDDSGKEGWDVIKPQLEEAKAGDTVTVAMNGTTVVPKDVIDSIKGKDTTLFRNETLQNRYVALQNRYFFGIGF